jgi:hypothetical protein
MSRLAAEFRFLQGERPPESIDDKNPQYRRSNDFERGATADAISLSCGIEHARCR